MTYRIAACSRSRTRTPRTSVPTRFLHAGSAALGALAAFLLAAPAAAQADESGEARDAWSAGLDLALTGTFGNQNFAVFSSGAQLRHLETDRYELELDAQLRYGRSEGEEIARKAQSNLKLDLQPLETWSPFLFLSGEHDAVRSLDLRLQSGAGAKYTLRREEAGEASISLAALYDREAAVGRPAASMARWSWRLRGEQPIGTGSISHTTFYQPLWDSARDYLLSVRTGFSTRITDNLALTLTHRYERDSTPPPGVQPADQSVDLGLTLAF